MDLELLLKAWQEARPESCVCKSHYNDHGKPLSDELVCQRERAWRAYTRVRDIGIEHLKSKNLGATKFSLTEIFEANSQMDLFEALKKP